MLVSLRYFGSSLSLLLPSACVGSPPAHTPSVDMAYGKKNYGADFDQVVQERFALAAEVSEPQLVSCFPMFCDRSEHRVCKFCSGPDGFF